MHPTSASLKTLRPPSSFPLDRIRLLPGPFKTAQDIDLRYVLELDADRLCAPYLEEAGLKTAEVPYGNWESDGMGGHIAGHYLSACARLFAATGDVRLLERVHYIVGVLEQCQAMAGTGYLGGVPGGSRLGEELAAGVIEADLFTLNGRWVPLYNLHKTFAGLLDAYTCAGSDNALAVLLRLADWWLTVSRRIDDDSFEEVLTTEFGGMNDVFASLAQLTGRKGYLREAARFSHRALLDPLAAGNDRLDGLHANTQIPKVVGYERYAHATGDLRYSKASDHFWEVVTRERTVSIGGNSVREHFHPSRDFTPMVLDVQGPETCNTYNMLKLAKLRFERTGDPGAMEFYERATFNHILSSQHPGRGGFVYFTPMRPSHYRVYSRVHESMWCCVGSGMENHASYGELIYSHSGDTLDVNLYIASRLDWTERAVQVQLETDFRHSDFATLTVTVATPTEFTLRLRRPAWATDVDVRAPRARGNVPEIGPVEQGNYVLIQRAWEGTTTISVRLRAEVRAETLPDGSPWVSFLYGPVVLAAREGNAGLKSFEASDERMGHVAAGHQVPLADTPVISAHEPVDAVVLKDRQGLAADLTATRDGSPVRIRLEPFAGIHDGRYTVYWPTGSTPATRTAELAAMDEDAAGVEAVIDAVTAGEQQPEADHFFTGEATRAGGQDGLHWRTATGWFSYTLKDPNREAAFLRVWVRSDPGRRQRFTLNGAPLTEMLRADIVHGHGVTDYTIPAAARIQDSVALVFAVHAEPGSATEDLLSVELRKATSA